MRLAFLTNVFPSPVSPTKGTFNLELAKALVEDCELSMIVPVAWTDQIRARRAGRTLPRNDVRHDAGFSVCYPTYWYSPGIGRSRYDQMMAWSLRTKLKEIGNDRPDAVLSYWAHPDGAVATRWARKLGIPSWMMLGGSDVLLLTKDRSRGDVIRAALKAADGVIAVSQDIANALSNLGVDSAKVHVIRRGVDDQTFHPRNRGSARAELGLEGGRPVLLWVGRMVSVKGLDRLLNAAAAAQNDGADFELVLVGDGPLRSTLESQAEELGLKRVRFVGGVAHSDLAAWYRAADWTLLSSLSEGIPNVLLESHACGTPFIATDVGGVSEIVLDGVDRLVPSDDHDALVRAITQASTNIEVDREAVSGSVGTLKSASQRVLSLIRQTLPGEDSAEHALNVDSERAS